METRRLIFYTRDQSGQMHEYQSLESQEEDGSWTGEHCEEIHAVDLDDEASYGKVPTDDERREILVPDGHTLVWVRYESTIKDEALFLVVQARQRREDEEQGLDVDGLPFEDDDEADESNPHDDNPRHFACGL